MQSDTQLELQLGAADARYPARVAFLCIWYIHLSSAVGLSSVRFIADEVYVSSLKYIDQLSTLCVGYNFGSFQLWSIDMLCLE